MKSLLTITSEVISRLRKTSNPVFLNIFFFMSLSINLLISCEAEKSYLKPETAIREALEEFNRAFRVNDIDKLQKLTSDSILHTNGSNKSINKIAWLGYLKSRQSEIQNGDLIIHSYEMSEIDIVQYKDAAIVTGKIALSYTRKEDKLKNEFRVTNIWMKEHGQWKRAGFHDGIIN